MKKISIVFVFVFFTIATYGQISFVTKVYENTFDTGATTSAQLLYPTLQSGWNNGSCAANPNPGNCTTLGYGAAYVVDIGAPFHGVVYPNRSCTHRASCETSRSGLTAYTWQVVNGNAYSKSMLYVVEDPTHMGKVHSDHTFYNPGNGHGAILTAILIGSGLSMSSLYGAGSIFGTQSCNFQHQSSGPGTCTFNSTCNTFYGGANPCFGNGTSRIIFLMSFYYEILATDPNNRRINNIFSQIHKCWLDGSNNVACGGVPFIIATVPNVTDNTVVKIPPAGQSSCTVCPPTQGADCAACIYGSDFINDVIAANTVFGDRIYPSDTYLGCDDPSVCQTPPCTCSPSPIVVEEDYSQAAQWAPAPGPGGPGNVLVYVQPSYIYFQPGTGLP